MTLPTAQFRRQTTRAPRAAFVWRARDLSLNAATGQAGTLVRAATGTSLDSYAASLTTVRDRPRWHITSSLAALKLGASEYLAWPVPTLPMAMSGLVEFIEDGSLAAGAEVLSITNSGSANPSFRVNSSATSYRLVHHNGTSSVSVSCGSAPTAGDRVRLRWWLYADGSVRLFQSKNLGAEVDSGATSALTLNAAWAATTTVYMNAFAASNYGVNIFLGAVVMPGNQTQATLLQALGY